MNQIAPPSFTETRPAARVIAGGCQGCWATGYCAAYTLVGPQPPLACPLEPKATCRASCD
ncbi:hypothetical protein GO988_20620 [Hymenobacter sp. HMF4947]|uniref:Uncharacterized protein n=1 Tax=Hymenobacter ginkgonis TaxID=2682976 RepID=A0A7K1TK10_9BACT|nr:hypothetical protein [Hymenobacter ginkgonis]MVN78744.1 hypothetical protein [Hymenobacter ginkgonis]